MSINEQRSYTEYNVTVPTTDFVVGFDFMDEGIDIVQVTLNDVDPTTLGYTILQINNTTYRFAPPVPEGIVRLSRVTDIDSMAHVFTEGAIFVSENMDGNFKQIRHAQQEVRDNFIKLRVDTDSILVDLNEVRDEAQAATQAANDAANTANEAAAAVNDKVSYGDLDNAVDIAVSPIKDYVALPYEPLKSYKLHERVQLANGDIVKSTEPNNIANPNVDMTGWVLESSKSVSNPSDLAELQNPKNRQRAYVESLQKTFTYNANLTTPDNGVTVVGKWEMETQEAYYASWFATSDVQSDQSDKLMTGYAYAASKKRPFIIDGVFYGNSIMDGVLLGGVFKAISNSIVFFKPDASINIIPNNQQNYAVLEVYDVENVVFIGAKFVGDKDQHTGSTGEWGHGVNLYPSKNIMFTRGLTIENCWGDGIYFGRPYFTVGTYSKPENISIDILNVNNVRRNAISLCAAKDLYIDKSNLKNISGAAPMAGVDIEPEEGDGVSKSNLENVVLNNTYIENALYSVAINIAGNRHVDVRFTGTTVFNNTSYPSTPMGFSVNIFTMGETSTSLNQTGEVYFENILMTDKSATNKFYAVCEVSLPKGGIKTTINNLQLDTEIVALFFSNNRATEFHNQSGLKINNVSRKIGNSFFIVNSTAGVSFTFGHHLGFDDDCKITSPSVFPTSDVAYIGGYSEQSANFIDGSTILANHTYLTPTDGGSGTYARVNINTKRKLKLTLNPSTPNSAIGYGLQIGGKFAGVSKRLESTTPSASICVNNTSSGAISVNSAFGVWNIV